MQKKMVCAILVALLAQVAWTADSKMKRAEVQDPVEQKRQNQVSTPGFIQDSPDVNQTPGVTSPQAFEIPWLSVNAGGAINLTSTNFELKASVGQSVIGSSASNSYQIGIGFWYGVTDTAGSSCIAKPGDANASGTYTLGDIISGVNYIFNKPGCDPTPLCWLSGLLCRGDWNASGTVTLGDVIQGVNYIFNKPNGPWDPVPSGVCCL